MIETISPRVIFRSQEDCDVWGYDGKVEITHIPAYEAYELLEVLLNE